MKGSITILTLEYPPDTGGIAEYIKNLERVMSDSGIHVHVLVKKISKYMNPGWLPMFYAITIRCLNKKHRPSAIIVHHILPVGMIAWCIKKMFGIPYTVFLHGYDAALVAESRGLKKRLARRVLQNADHIIVNSTATNSSLKKIQNVPEGVIVYPCPSVTPEMYSDTKPVSSTAVTFLCVARLVPRKNITDLLRAFEKVYAQNKNSKLYVIGDGPSRKDLENQANSQASRKAVEFLGALSPDACRKWYADSDIFVLTPKDQWPDVEGFGMVYLEAASFGKPSIGSNAGGVPEAVIDGQTGIIVRQGNVDDLASAMIKLMEDKTLRHRLGVAGKKRVQDKFTWKNQLRPVIEWSRKFL